MCAARSTGSLQAAGARARPGDPEHAADPLRVLGALLPLVQVPAAGPRARLLRREDRLLFRVDRYAYEPRRNAIAYSIT